MNKWLKAASRRNELMVSTPQLEPATTEQAPFARAGASKRATSVSVALLMLVVGLWIGSMFHAVPGKFDGNQWVFALLVFVAFVVAERMIFHIEFASETKSVSLTSVAVALSLLLVGALGAQLVRMVAVLMEGVSRRVEWYKTLYNMGMATLSLGVGYSVYQAISDGATLSTTTVLGLTAAILVMELVENLGVCVAIMVHTRQMPPRFFRALFGEVPGFLVSSVIGSMVAVLSVSLPWLAPVFMLPLLGVFVVLRSHGRTTQRLRDLEELHGLSASIGRSLSKKQIAKVALGEVSQLLRAERVAVVIFEDRTADGVHVASIGATFDSLPTSDADPRWKSIVSSRKAALWVSEELRELGIYLGSVQGNVIVAPLVDNDATVGVLVVGARGGQVALFDQGDAIRLGAFATRVALALRNAVLYEQLQYEAWHDRLTNLPNRLSFERRVDEVLDLGVANGTVAVLTLGIDRFREVNATLGHSAGDQMLLGLARRLEGLIGPDDVLSRTAGDEFAVFVRVTDTHDEMRLARSILDAAQAPLTVDGYDVSVVLSIGSARCDDVITTASTMLRRADIAMSEAKISHTGYEPYRAEIDRRTPFGLSMLGDLRAAIDHKDLEVYFQPKLDIASGMVVGLEALVRWQHPTEGFVPPLDFVQLAENTGLITALTQQVIENSVKSVRLLNDLGFDLKVSMNLSTLDLLDETLLERVERCLIRNAVPADQLIFEITETAMLTSGPRTMATAVGLQQLGIGLSIDDFGTGFSSLSYLRTLPATELKVDRSFVANLTTDERDEVIVRSTIDLGHNLGLSVVAEGVEDRATLDSLRRLGCDLAQGFGISKPIPLDRLLVWLNTGDYAVKKAARPRPTPVLSRW